MAWKKKVLCVHELLCLKLCPASQLGHLEDVESEVLASPWENEKEIILL